MCMAGTCCQGVHGSSAGGAGGGRGEEAPEAVGAHTGSMGTRGDLSVTCPYPRLLGEGTNTEAQRTGVTYPSLTGS